MAAVKAMIDGRVYDTERAEEVTRFTRQVDMGPLFCGDGRHWMEDHECVLYRTAGGGYFRHDTEDGTIAALTRREVRALMRELEPEADGAPLCWGA